MKVVGVKKLTTFAFFPPLVFAGVARGDCPDLALLPVHFFFALGTIVLVELAGSPSRFRFKNSVELMYGTSVSTR